jgi:putative spermidine/putrescine transport system ATP-binding protein
MDEPLSNLDAKLRLEMRTEIRRLHQSLGLTTVYVTHDQEEALSMADRLVVLRDGRVQQVGTPEELHTRPANRHVADFMGYRNLLSMTVADATAESVTVEGSGFRLTGTPVSPLKPSDQVIAAIRPEDLVPGAEGVLATVDVVEYQGRELAVEARTESGVALHLRAIERPSPGDKITVTADPARVLVFPS